MISQFSTVTQSPYLAYPTPKRTSINSLNDEDIDFSQIPSLLFHAEYLKNHRELYKKIQHISDYMLMNGPSVYNHGNPNTMKCRPAYRGEIDQRDYEVADSFYGKPGSAKIRDFAFYHSVTQRHIGESLQQPLKFTYRDVSAAATERRNEAVARQMNENTRRQLADALSQVAEQQGQSADFSFFTNSDILVPEDMFTPPTHSVEERAGHALLVDVVKKHRVKDTFRKCREDAIQINARMSHIITDRRGVRPERLDPDRVHWIAPGPITSDRDCDAIGTWDFPSVTEILNQDGHLFENASSIRGLTQTVESLREGSQLWYNPRQYWLNGETQLAQPGDRDNPLMLRAMWQDKFYPGADVMGHLNGEDIGVLRHFIYFKMIHFLRVKVLLNGKKATQERFQEWKLRDYDRKIDCRFEPIDEGEAVKRDDFVQKIPIVNMYQARRYGHNVLVGVQRCTHTPKIPKPNADIRFPIVIQVSFKRGFVALGLDFRRMWNLLWNRIEEQLNLGGAENALLIDTAQVSLKESKSLMWQAKKTAVIHYNSSKIQDRSNQQAAKHLTRVQLTSESSTINNMLSLAGLLKSVYDGMVGDPGGAGAYDSANKLSIINSRQSAITSEFSYEDNLFQSETLQRTAEIQKMIVNGDEWADISYGGATSGRVGDNRNKRKSVFIPKSIKEVEPLVEVDNGLELLNIRQEIKNMAEKVLPSGGSGGIREFIRLLFEDDPYEALSIFDQGMTEVEKAEAASNKAAQENAAARNQVEAQKSQIPLQTMKMRTEADILIAHAKEESKRTQMDQKGDFKDIDEQNARERMALQHELNTDNQMQVQDQDAQNQAQLQDQNTENQAALNQQQARLDTGGAFPEEMYDQ